MGPKVGLCQFDSSQAYETRQVFFQVMAPQILQIRTLQGLHTP